SPANVAGEWQISGDGHCSNQDGITSKVEIEGTQRLTIVQNDRGDLALADPAAMLTLSGTVHGSCVDFTLRETTPGSVIAYSFKGVVKDTELSGDVNGTGDGICPFEGNFNVSVFSTSSPHFDAGAPYDAGGEEDGGVEDSGTRTSTPADGGFVTPE